MRSYLGNSLFLYFLPYVLTSLVACVLLTTPHSDGDTSLTAVTLKNVGVGEPEFRTSGSANSYEIRTPSKVR